MKLVVCSVMDAKVGAFATPFFSRSRGEAMRGFEDACRDDKMPFKAHLSDYSLWCVGEFDDGDGLLVGVTPFRLVGGDELGIMAEERRVV